MICFVYLEHGSLLQDPVLREGSLARCLEAKLRLEEISGLPCLIQHYTRVRRRLLARYGIQAMVISGNRTPWERYDFCELEELLQIIREADLPILGICGGWQLIAMAFGADVGPMRRLEPAEKDLMPDVGPGYCKEWGFVPVRVQRPDPLFYGLGDSPVFFEAHFCEAKELPAGFEVLASSPLCPIQAARYRSGRARLEDDTGAAIGHGGRVSAQLAVRNPADWATADRDPADCATADRDPAGRDSAGFDTMGCGKAGGGERLIYGTQFHPESYDEEHPDGRALLSNFFALCGLTP